MKISGSHALKNPVWGNIILVVVTLGVVVLGALLPIRWMGVSAHQKEPSMATSAKERRECWLDYYVQESDTGTYPTELDTSQIQQMQAMVAEIASQVSVDRGVEQVEARGEECLSVWSGDRRTRVWHYYRQWRGDWRNWLELYIDVDTREVYYLYISSGCEQNQALYRGLTDVSDPGEKAAAFLTAWGMTITSTAATADDFTSRVTCINRSGNSIYDVTWKYYPGSLLDYRIQLTET